MSGVGDRLRAARENKRLKQTQVKDRTGIHNKTLSGYENGVSEPDLETLRTLANLYEVSVDSLMATGVDLKNLNSINFSTPLSNDTYIQQLGRAGRVEENNYIDLSGLLERYNGITFNGELLTKEQIETLKKFISSVILG